MDIPVLVAWLTVIFSLAYSVSNGWNDSANAISTVVSTRVMSPWKAILFGSSLNFVGAFLSSKVANTVGREVVNPQCLSQAVFLAAVIVAPVWVTLCTWRGLPISCSHSLMGGLIGAAIAATGMEALEGTGVKKIALGIVLSPVMGFVLGYAILLGIKWTFRHMRPTVAGSVFGKLQIVSAGAMALAHGAGDAQVPMGLIAGALVSGGLMKLEADGTLMIPVWTRVLCALAMTLGTAVGGWAVMRTLGSRLTNIKTHQGFAATAAAATTILVNTLWKGVPISTTHSLTGSIMGVGSVRGVRAVRWGVGRKILFAWIFTLPTCVVAGAAVYGLLRLIGLK